jgi:hypothetical protein
MMDEMNEPVACSLGSGELNAKRTELLPALVERAATREMLSAGYRLTFTADADLIQLIARVIDAERQCCRFLQFQLTVPASGGQVTLDVTGPNGTREFLEGTILRASD